MISALHLRLTLVGTLLFFVATPASAALIDNGTSMNDTGTGLEWLDLSVTNGQSINTALANNPAYSLATTTQVSQMFTNAGFSNVTAGVLVIDLVPAQTLLSFLGCTASVAVCAGVNAYSRGFAFNPAGGTFPYLSPTYVRTSTSGDAYLTLASNDANAVFADRGVYLVRALVPEPNTALLVGLGLVGLGVRRRERC